MIMLLDESISTQHQLIGKLKHLTGRFFNGFTVIHINTIQYNEQMCSFKTYLKETYSSEVKMMELQGSSCKSVL